MAWDAPPSDPNAVLRAVTEPRRLPGRRREVVREKEVGGGGTDGQQPAASLVSSDSTAVTAGRDRGRRDGP